MKNANLLLVLFVGLLGCTQNEHKVTDENNNKKPVNFFTGFLLHFNGIF